jgi:aldose sugar dehydrogenase
MNKKFRIGGIIAALIVSAVILTSPSNPPPIPEPILDNAENQFVEILAINLEKPWSIDFADDRIFISEKVGTIRVIDSDKLLDEPLVTLRTANVFDGGLLGIALHPNFAENNFLYAYYTYTEDGELWNKVIQIKESNNKIINATTILDKIPGSSFSNGGIIKFGPDSKLYIGTGSVSDFSHESQNLESLEGKILRLNDDGSIPDDNPFEDSPVYSYGHRNPKGMAWDMTETFYVTELGPSKNDEINIIIPGKNYGWPNVQCYSNNVEFENPVKCFDPSLEPGGIIFYSGDKLSLENYMILASQKASNLYKVELDENGMNLDGSILSGVGRIRDVAQGPDGYLYVITSNTDGKGFPSNDDDKLLRIMK